MCWLGTLEMLIGKVCVCAFIEMSVCDWFQHDTPGVMHLRYFGSSTSMTTVEGKKDMHINFGDAINSRLASCLQITSFLIEQKEYLKLQWRCGK